MILVFKNNNWPGSKTKTLGTLVKNLFTAPPTSPRQIPGLNTELLQLCLCIILCLAAPAAETGNDLSSWVGEELNVSDRPGLTSVKVVVSGGVTIKDLY